MNFHVCSMQVGVFFPILISIISVYIIYAMSSTPSLASGDDHNAIISSIRNERPGNFLFKIDSFSLLRETLETNGGKYESCHFEAGGYEWKLSLYPKGDKKRGGDGYISLYLILADPKSLPPDEEVTVFFKFLVFDYLRDTYLVLQDGKDKRFHVMNREWGVAKLLPLEIFKNASQGYLVDDSCVFGVEMFFHSKERKSGSLSIKNDLRAHESSYSWRIDRFSTLREVYKSDVFSVGEQKWTLKLYPRGESMNNYKIVALYLEVHDHSSLPRGWTIYAEFKLGISDQLFQNHFETKVIRKWFSADATTWGYPEFIQLSDLKSGSRGFIVRDTAIITVRFTGTIIANSLA